MSLLRTLILGLLVLGSVMSPLTVEAQTVVRGRVVDGATGEPLPSAGIQVEGTLRGTITNRDGQYEITLEQLPATLLFRYIGYETARVEVAEVAREELDVRLEPTTLLLAEIVVTGEDPARNIMRKVIERKQAWRDSLRTYRAEAYNRFTLANDTGIVSINEALTDVYWDREKGSKEVVKAQRQTANQNFDEFLPAAFFITNLYDDDVEVAGYELIGVTHPDALRHYAFRLDSTRQFDGQLVYDIAVRPKNKFKSAFEGRVAVLDSVYALLEVELRPSEAFLFPPPINRLDITYRQQFSSFGRDFWLPVDFRSETDVKIKLSGLLELPTIHVQQTARLTDYDINVALPDSLYATEDDYLAVDTAAVEADTLLEGQGAIVPLSVREAEAYTAIDSTETLDKAFAPSGPLARFIDMEDDDEERGRGDSDGGFGVGLPDWLSTEPLLWFNRVEAVHVGMEADVRLPGPGRASVRGGYQTGPGTWTYGAATEWEIAQRVTLGAAYRYGTTPRYTSDVYGHFLNSAAMLFGETDYFDYLGSERVRFTADVRPRRLDANLTLGLNRERAFSVHKTTDYDFLADRFFRPNPAVQEGRLRSLSATLAWGDDAPLGIIGRRRLELAVEYSPEGFLGNAFDFTRFEGALDWRFVTLLSRRLLPNTLDVRLVGGTFRGRLPIQRLGIVDGALSLYAPFGGLRTLSGRPYEGEQYAALFWEHNFRTLPFELVGLYGLARRGYNLLVFGGHARTWVSNAGRARHAPNVSDGFHHEVGVSLSGLFGLLRLNLGARLDEPGFAIGLSTARLF
ncbi:MAG: DUF5686 family protein [Rhodothermales bacterium]